MRIQLPLICISVVLLAMYVLTPATANANTSWFYPILNVSESYDDNIFLTSTDEIDDLITTVSPGFVIQPELSEHELEIGYIADLEFFNDNSNQNTKNHSAATNLTLNFPNWKIVAQNLYRYFENRIGTEDTARIPRTTNDSSLEFIYEFNKMDFALKYDYQLDNYRSNLSIGDFQGQALTYQDLDSEEQSAEVELGFKLWPKTTWLLGGRYGMLTYDTGLKSDSDYFDLLTGVRGRLMKRGKIEGKVGFRIQNYENFSDDFDNIIFEVSIIEKFTSMDTLIINFNRTTNSTIYQDNAYFESSRASAQFSHGFTENFSCTIGGSYQLNDYPVQTTEGTQTGNREDKLISGQAGIAYKLSDWGSVNLDYTYTQRRSNFGIFEYDNNLVTFGINLEI